MNQYFIALMLLRVNEYILLDKSNNMVAPSALGTLCGIVKLTGADLFTKKCFLATSGYVGKSNTQGPLEINENA